MMGRRNIVWIASYPKSGSTWFRAVLNNLESESTEPTSINKIDISGIASSRSMFDQLSGINSSDLSKDEIELYRPLVYKQLSADSEKTIYLKVHDAWSRNKAGNPLFPEELTKGVIYIIRHPLDVAVSLSHHNAENVEESMRKMNDASYGLCLSEKRLFNQLPQKMHTWSDHVRSWLVDSGLRVHLIRYEDMIDHPFETFGSGMKYLGLTFTEKKLREAIKNSDFKILKRQEQAEGFVEKPINASSFFRKGIKSDWINHLGKESAEAFLLKNKEVFQKFYR